ncbi:MAG: RagB/SusD family nutrient uptake outer membrane protein [Parabacteroides sp.]|nr:RagB/SusD family nutrient uptake outer membrane protein [Parabacteroides sp.]
MKNIIYIANILLLFFVMSSCHDDLNNYPLSDHAEDKVWNSAASAQLFINGTLYVKDHLLDRSNNHSDDWSDDMVINSQMSTAQNTVRELLTSDHSIGTYGWNMFPEIRRCNLIIEKVASSTTIEENQKDYLIAQGKLLRAIVYYNMARKFGRLILIDKVLTPDEELMLGRTSTIKETYDFILNDLKDAAANLPVNAEAGGISKGAAYALLAEAALQGAAYLDNANEKNEYYQISKKASEDLLALNKYSLESDYDKLFNDFTTGLTSDEVILGSYFLADNTYTSGTWKMKFAPNQGSSNKLPEAVGKVWPMNDFFEGWFEKSPSQEIVNAYQVIDADGVAKEWDKTTYYENFRQGVDYVHNMMYTNRDARFYSTITYDSCWYMNSLLTMRLGGNMYYKNNMEKDQHMTKSGYIYRKGSYLDNNTIIGAGVKMNYHLTPLRLGRSYMNYAEVLLRLNKTAEAIEIINKTRTVHGQLPPLPTSLSNEDAWKYYKNERRVELVLENDRYWSLLRWGKEEKLSVIPELNTPPKAIEISEDGKSYKFIDVPVVHSANNRSFTARRYFLPIPRSEILTNSALTNDQNEGWE